MGSEIGAPAPSLELPTASGLRRSLEEFRGRSVLISFLGPANCVFCRAHVIRMIQARQAIAAANAEVVLVAYHDPDQLMTQMFRSLDLPYLLLHDPTRETYLRWGLGRVGVRALLSPGMYLALARAMLRREPSLGPAPRDPAQYGGDFVVDREGRMAFAHRMRSIHDRPKIPDLLSAVPRP